MRALAICAVVLGLIVSPTMARAGGPGDKDSANKAGATTGNSAAKATSAAGAPAPAAKADPAAKAAPSSAEVESELQQMRDLLEAQAKQLQEQQQRMNQLEEQLNASQPGLMPAAAPANSASAPVGPVGPVTGAVAAAQPAQKENPDEPTSLHFKGVTLTPGGFFAAESVWRQKALSADVNTPFNTVPYSGANNAAISEHNASARQSRISMLVQGKLDNVKLAGYYETDFLSAGVTSNDNQSNSFTLRQRQFWGQAAFNSGWAFTGGQMWSLVTETTKGLDNRTEAAPATIDAQYNVGFSWARQYGFRVTKNFNNKFWLGLSVENSQTTPIVNHGASANYLVGAPGANGGLLPSVNNFTYNANPDFIVKAAWEPTSTTHFEIFGVVGDFRARVFPCATVTATTVCGGFTGPSGALGFNDKKVAGGGGANARIALLDKKVTLGVHFLGGDGVGRYGTSQLVDATVHPDGTLEPVRSYQGLGTIEFHPTPKLDLYMYVGDEYAQRTQYNFTPTGFTVGYGATGLKNFGCSVQQAPGANGFSPTAPANCTGDTRNIMEGTFGFWYRFYKGSRGTVQFGTQYSYVTRSAWSGIGTGTQNGVLLSTAGTPTALDNMVLTSFRYYIP
jgi:hypothetical protein